MGGIGVAWAAVSQIGGVRMTAREQLVLEAMD